MTGSRLALTRPTVLRKPVRGNGDCFRSAFECAAIGMALLSKDGHWLQANRSLCDLLGYTEGELLDLTLPDITHPDDLDTDLSFIREMHDGTRGSYQIERRYLKKSGAVVQALLSMARVTDGNGDILYFICQLQDITGQERTIELLDLNAKIVARAPVGIIVYAASGECLLANPESASIVSDTVEDVMRHPFTELRFWRETGLLQAATEALATGTARRESVHVATPTGRDLWLDCDLVPFTSRGNPRLLYIMADVTAFRLAEFALGDAKRAAELASHAKGQFLANMSHEIRTPMTAIMGFTSLLEEAPLESRERDYVAKIKMSAASLLGILNDVLDFSKIEAGRLDLERTQFSLQDVMRSIAVIVGANAAIKNLEVVYDMADDVPDGLTGDPLRLQQILLNLAGNAVKFTSIGEVVLAVRKVASRPDGVDLEFLIRDTGIGIEAAARHRLFQAFSQADASTTRKFGGSGLGLAICSRLVALMGGTIAVSSTPGAGSEFRVAVSFGEAPQAVTPRRAFVGLEGLGVLVVDDNDTARQVLARTCETFGWRATVAASGPAGLDALRQASAGNRPFDILLLDWRMPDMDGLEMLRRASGDPAITVPPVVLMVTVSDTGEVRRQASGMHIDGVLAKPATPSAIFDVVARLRGGTEEAVPSGRATPSGMSGRLRGVRLLLVEDNEVNQQVASSILRRANADVTTVNSGEAAVTLLRGQIKAFDAVLMDVQMPGMSGYETTRIIRSLPGLSALPIIAMTANAMASDREDSRRAGMNDHLAKPIDVEEMFAILRKWVGPPPTDAPRTEPSEATVEDFPTDLPGIDFAEGLSRAIGQPDLYRRLLNDIVSNHAGDAGLIASALELGDGKQALYLAHALKGLAGNLGVHRVAGAAGALEEALGAKGGGADHERVSKPIGDLIAELSAGLREAVDSIHRLDGVAAAIKTADQTPAPPDGGATLVHDLLAELRSNDTNALVTLHRLVRLSTNGGPALEPLEAAVESLDFEQALVEMERLAPALSVLP